MAQTNHMLTAREAARLLGVSYPAIKQWILNGKIATTKTPGGHHRISERTLKPFLMVDAKKPPRTSRERFRRVSGRNQIVGKVISVRIEGLLAEIVLATTDAYVTAIITAGAARELSLKKGQTAAALIKATDVMIEHVETR
jgi:molybdopterin-binding protein